MAKIVERKIILDEPVLLGGKEVLELTMRRPKVRDMLEAQELAGPNASQARIEANLFAVLCDIPFEAILDWDLEGNYGKLQDGYTFLTRGGSRKPEASEEQS